MPVLYRHRLSRLSAGQGGAGVGGGEPDPYDPYYNPDNDSPVFALLGDSITAGNTPTSNGQTNVGYWWWTQIVLGYRVYTPVFAGIGGNTTTQMLARLNTDIITPMAPYVAAARDCYCLVMGGVNDSTNASDIVATATANLEAIYDGLIAAGITPIAVTITPTVNVNTTTKIANWDGIQSWLRSYCPVNSITLCDVDADCRDASQTTVRVWNTGFAHDGVHPTARGAQAISRAIATGLSAIFDPIEHFVTDTSTPSNFLISNPAMTGTGGRAIDNGASGTVADGWEVEVGVGSKESRVDGKTGEWQAIAINSGSVRLSRDNSIELTSGFAVGDTIMAQAEVYCVDDWVDVTQFLLFLTFRDGSGQIGNGYTSGASNPNTGIIPNPNPGSTVILRTIPATVPVGTTRIWTYLWLVGTGGTIKAGRYEVKNLG